MSYNLLTLQQVFQLELSHVRLTSLDQSDRVSKELVGEAADKPPWSSLLHDLVQTCHPVTGQPGIAPCPIQELLTESGAPCMR